MPASVSTEASFISIIFRRADINRRSRKGKGDSGAKQRSRRRVGLLVRHVLGKRTGMAALREYLCVAALLLAGLLLPSSGAQPDAPYYNGTVSNMLSGR